MTECHVLDDADSLQGIQNKHQILVSRRALTLMYDVSVMARSAITTSKDLPAAKRILVSKLYVSNAGAGYTMTHIPALLTKLDLKEGAALFMPIGF